MNLHTGIICQHSGVYPPFGVSCPNGNQKAYLQMSLYSKCSFLIFLLPVLFSF